MRIPDPDGTRQPCRQGCGQPTVLAEEAGQQVRVHCGTWRAECPR